MGYIVGDCETTGLTKPFDYDLGYLVFSDDHKEVARRHYVVEQNWHNLPLFESAYYAEKRPLYISLMRGKKAVMDKWGYIMRQLRKDIKDYNVTSFYAYNSAFDDKVIAFNCDWFKCNNPLETIPVHDIWGYASQFITNTKEYQNFCEEHQYFTEHGNYSSSAETVYRYITGNTEFNEAHIGLNDSEIEAEILRFCFEKGAIPENDYDVVRTLNRPRPYTIKINGQVVHIGKFTKKYERNNVFNFIGEEA